MNTKSGQERKPAGLKDYMKGDSHFLQVKDQTGNWWEGGAWEMWCDRDKHSSLFLLKNWMEIWPMRKCKRWPHCCLQGLLHGWITKVKFQHCFTRRVPSLYHEIQIIQKWLFTTRWTELDSPIFCPPTHEELSNDIEKQMRNKYPHLPHLGGPSLMMNFTRFPGLSIEVLTLSQRMIGGLSVSQLPVHPSFQFLRLCLFYVLFSTQHKFLNPNLCLMVWLQENPNQDMEMKISTLRSISILVFPKSEAAKKHIRVRLRIW